MRKNALGPNLQSLQVFRRVVELRSFQAAAQSMGLSGGTVSKLVAQLEADVGVRLLHRTTRSMAVTEAGQGLYQTAVRIQDELANGLDLARQAQSAVEGVLRVAVPTSFALMWMSSRMPRFMDLHPQITLDLSLNDSFVDLVAQGFDAAVRITQQLPDSGLVARPLGTVSRVAVAAPHYLAVAPPLDTPDDVAFHACLLYTQTPQPFEWPATVPGRSPVAVTGHYRVNNSVMLRDALVAGQGVALTPRFVVDDLLRRGALVEVLADHRLTDLTAFGVVPQPRYLPRKVRAFFEFLESEMAASPL
ncbi:LysR family transcriptional regulator [Rhodoferax sp.]|uniref:LysR family transcriptional regulator n=1 Tax=Rhodoferax sp. TaxID=50421 RepID=UPI002ACE6E1E|nr:LysR family transcriptional regulator [Rhodoferax sp.]MDZ7919846.1 LysR family transcriptional regulator [Rhodoferax sp.]